MEIIKAAKVRTEEEIKALSETVSGIIDKVKTEGDYAIDEYNALFDGCVRDSLRVSREEIEAAYAAVPRKRSGT